MTSIELTPIQLLVYFGVLNSLILCSLLLYTRKNTKAAKWLALFVANIPLNLLNYTFIKDLYASIEWFTLVRIPTLYATGLFFWLYVQHLIRSNFRLSKKYYWVLLPFILDVCYSFLHAGYIYAQGIEQKADLFYVHEEHLVHEGLAILYNVGLYLWAYFEVKGHNKTVENTLSSFENVDLRWLQWLFILILLPNAAWMILYGVEWWLFPAYLPFSAYYLLWCYSIVMSMIVAYKSLLQPQMKALEQNTTKQQRVKYQNSKLSSADLLKMGERLKAQVETRKLYLTPNLKLSELSKETEWTTHQLSQIISEGLGTNFYDFVNQYRVDEVKRKLAAGEADQFSLLSLAFDAGFNSKTAFYTAFKKYTGTTPGKYLKSL